MTVSFDGSARVTRGGDAYNAILWKLPEWRVLKARSRYAEGLTVNEAEYQGLFLCLDLLKDLDPRRLVICGDSNLVIRQVRVKGEDEIAQISTVTTRSKARAGVRMGSDPDSLREEVVRELQIEGIRQAQAEEPWISGLKKYLVGEVRNLTQEDAKGFGSIAVKYAVDPSDLLFYCPTTKEEAAERDRPLNRHTELLIFVDLFSGYVIAKASASRSAQTIAETYEECVFRRFDPGTTSTCYYDLSTQANGSTERMVQTTTRALKIYVHNLNQRDWDEYAERLTFAINTARDRIRGETPFYMIHGWDPRSPLEALIPVGSTRSMIETQEDGDIGYKGTINNLENK
ncbi:reverse transcriptase [Phytophthora megakarya]|uniref:Reverse transcriptase n=1 Tax=Phytophthora megakarya TaxID=4795 RepID=A0A225VVW4_9STRA|nr:reverse transcriptase [Phytophthora megakarya]